MPDPWTEGIPPRGERSAPRIDVLTPTYHYPVEVTLLTCRLFVRFKHYDREIRRPWPCSGRGVCNSCLNGLPKYPTGYMACASSRSARLFIVQFSDAAMNDLDIYTRSAPLLRGVMIRTKRRDHRANSKMYVEFLGRDPRESLPEEFDPRPTLELMWGLAEAKRLVPHELGGPHDTTRARQARRGR